MVRDRKTNTLMNPITPTQQNQAKQQRKDKQKNTNRQIRNGMLWPSKELFTHLVTPASHTS